MSDISIVTAFYDIGRGDWAPWNGYPNHLYRPTDVYMQRFAWLSQLENDITVFTSADLVDRVRDICKDRLDRTNIIALDVFTHFAKTRERIIQAQQDPNFQAMIKPDERVNPEYWNPDYNLVTNLKPFFVSYAIQQGLPEHEMVAWIDFGYPRSPSKIPQSRIWQYDFNPEKIHLFSYKPYDGRPIKEIMAANDVFIFGCKAVAHKSKWQHMESLMWKSVEGLLDEKFTDDDQGHWLHATVMDPDAFELHTIPDHQLGHDSFVLFNEFNDAA